MGCLSCYFIAVFGEIFAMTSRDMKHMSRRELLELLVAQMAENETLKKDLAQAQAALEDRRIAVENAGSLAEAAVRLSGVFEAAQDAARRYLENLQLRGGEEARTAGEIEAEARERAEAILADARAEAEACTEKARQEADAYWQRVSAKAERLLQELQRRRDGGA